MLMRAESQLALNGLEWLSTDPVALCDRPLTACTKEEVDEAYAAAQAAQKQWAKTPLHKAAALLKAQAAPIAECLVKVGSADTSRVGSRLSLRAHEPCPDSGRAHG